MLDIMAMDSISFYTAVGGSLVAAATVTYYYVQSMKDEPPRLFHTGGPLVQYVLQRVKRLTETFSPLLLARSGHLQTCLPSILGREIVEFQRQLLPLDDGGTIALDWGIPGSDKLRNDSPVLLALPGLTSDCKSMAFLCQYAGNNGFRTVVFNKRGLGNSPLTTPRFLGFGDPTDLREVVKYIRRCYPESHIVAVGNSAGSGLLAAYVGEYGEKADLAASIFISPGYYGEKLIRGLVPQPYDFILLRGLKRVIQEHSDILDKVLDIPAVMNAKTMEEFEVLVYCRMFGYKTLHDYWVDNEPLRTIRNTAVPVLCINSEDDPICVKECIPFEIFATQPDSILVYTKLGGHCGFFETLKLQSWADKLALEYSLAVIEYLNMNKQECQEQ